MRNNSYTWYAYQPYLSLGRAIRITVWPNWLIFSKKMLTRERWRKAYATKSSHLKERALLKRFQMEHSHAKQRQFHVLFLATGWDGACPRVERGSCKPAGVGSTHMDWLSLSKMSLWGHCILLALMCMSLKSAQRRSSVTSLLSEGKCVPLCLLI